MSDERQVALYKERGLTPNESQLASTWNEPINPERLERARLLYVELGMDCQTIAERHGEYTLPQLLAGRGQLDWDGQRRLVAQQRQVEAFISSGMGDSSMLSFLNKVTQAVRQKYEQELEEFITDPRRKEFPKISREHFLYMKECIQLAREMRGLDRPASKDAGGGVGAGILENVIVVKPTKPAAVEISAEDLKAAILDSIKEEKKDE